jgi:amino acid transporter
MWGVIIFLRFYLIVGYAGLGLTILIVTLSFGVALTTALAMSAIATCGSHTAHGVYMMLVRALGKEIATATGIVYFLGFVCLAVLECLGACEKLFALDETLKLTGSFRFRNFDVRLWGSIFMLFCALCNYAGTKIVSQIGVLFFIIALYTLISFYIYILRTISRSSELQISSRMICRPGSSKSAAATPLAATPLAATPTAATPTAVPSTPPTPV